MASSVARIRRTGPIVAAGGRYLQIDEVALPLLCDENLRGAVRARGDDPDALKGKSLRRRIADAARYVAIENLSLSPQCGFASHRKGTALTFAEQEAKLKLVVETATEVWGEA